MRLLCLPNIEDPLAVDTKVAVSQIFGDQKQGIYIFQKTDQLCKWKKICIL